MTSARTHRTRAHGRPCEMTRLCFTPGSRCPAQSPSRLGLAPLSHLLGLAVFLAASCAPATEPEDPRITAQWESPATCSALAYSWLSDHRVGAVLDWEEDELFDYNTSMLETALGASGYNIAKPFLYDVRMFRFRYLTQDRGELVEATSTMAVPVLSDGDPSELPLLAYLHGTAGFSDGCAPSANLVDPLVAAALASIGHVVIGPDYLGMMSMGGPSPHVHPYLVAEPTAIASIDAVRAGRALLPALDMSVALEPGLSVMGGSQGGHAALAFAWYAPYYAPDLEVTAVAASVPPADLLHQAVKAASQLVNATSNLVAFLGTFADWYGADLSEALLPPHDTYATSYLATACSPSGITNGATDLTKVFTPAFLDLVEAGFPDDGNVWSCVLRANSFPYTPLEPLSLPPTIFVLSELDELVDTPIERSSFDRLCDLGWPMQYLECAGTEHAEGAVGSFAEQVDFLAARRRGDPWPAELRCVRSEPVVCSGTEAQ